MPRIYLSPPDVGPVERELLLDAFDSNWVAPLGPHVDAFEREMCAYTGVDAAAALSSGTAGLHLALLLAGVGNGDDVLCSDLTFAATANAIRYCGAVPTFIDSERTSWNMDPDLLAEELERRAAVGRLPKAVVVVDIYGQCADYDRILPICESYDVPVIEDAAEALGATYRGKKAGSFGLTAVLSFNGNKIITTSGGGMLLSSKPGFVDRARFLATQAREPVAHYEHETIGYNYRLSNLLAALGRGQLLGLEGKIAKRRATFAAYEAALGQLPGVSFMPEASFGRSNRWLTCMVIDAPAFGADREAIRLELAKSDIEARPLWKPMHVQPVFSECRIVGGTVSRELFERGLCIPSGSNLSDEDRTRIIEIVKSVALGHPVARVTHA